MRFAINHKRDERGSFRAFASISEVADESDIKTETYIIMSDEQADDLRLWLEQELIGFKVKIFKVQDEG